MLAGSTRWSIFSPARIWPLSWSISSHAVPVTEGGGGVGRASSGCAAGAGAGVGASWASARPMAKVASAATAVRRKTAGKFIELGTPVVRSSLAGRKQCARAAAGGGRKSLLANDLGFAQAQPRDAGGKIGQRRLPHRAYAHAPQGAAGAGHVLHPGLGDAGVTQRGQGTLGVVAHREHADLHGHAAGDGTGRVRARGRRGG